MLVVPISGDIVHTKDGIKYRVVSYTNYKDGGPAVYCRSKESKDLVLIYFFDIDSINSTKVEFQKGSRIFRSLGKLKRSYQLPQPEDRITVASHEISDEETKNVLTVESLKLKSKSAGVNKGLMIKDDKGNLVRLKHVISIVPEMGHIDFNKDAFHELYKEYLGV